jgi:hypothetical protein
MAATVAIPRFRHPVRQPRVSAIARAQMAWGLVPPPQAASPQGVPSPCHPQDSLIPYRGRRICGYCGHPRSPR